MRKSKKKQVRKCNFADAAEWEEETTVGAVEKSWRRMLPPIRAEPAG